MQYEVNPKYQYLEPCLLTIPERFEREGEVIYKGRNTLKVFDYLGVRLCVKSFKVPHLINKMVYAYFRKSKAERSFRFATRFVDLGIGTPAPVAYLVFRNNFGVSHSYYISLQQDCDFTFRGIATLPEVEQDEVYRAFARFTYDFHAKGVFFVDHSPGNTLIKKDASGQWHFWLVDLNRTRFGKVSTEEGLKNLCMLELPDDKLTVIAREYARLTNSDPEKMVSTLITLTRKHNQHVKRKDWIRDTRRAIKRCLFH